MTLFPLKLKSLNNLRGATMDHFTCQICNKNITLADRMCYTDKKRNLIDAAIHQQCYYKHILKYYPNSKIAKNIIEKNLIQS